MPIESMLPTCRNTNSPFSQMIAGGDFADGSFGLRTGPDGLFLARGFGTGREWLSDRLRGCCISERLETALWRGDLWWDCGPQMLGGQEGNGFLRIWNGVVRNLEQGELFLRWLGRGLRGWNSSFSGHYIWTLSANGVNKLMKIENLWQPDL